MNLDIFSPISAVSGIGPVYLKKLDRLGLKTVRDLLYHFPHRYEDFSNLAKIRDLAVGGEAATVQGKIIDIKNIRSWKKKIFITEALVEDDTGAVKAVWFNQPYLAKIFRKNMLVNLSGKIAYSKDGLAMMSPVYEIIASDFSAARKNIFLKHTAGLIPIYPLKEGLTSRALRFFIKPLLKFVYQLPDVLPPSVKKSQKLLDLKIALWQIHFPKSLELAQKARHRLAFEEIFLWQLVGLGAKRKIQKEKALAVTIDVELARKFTASLPYKLTDSQRVAAWRILKDMSRPRPMNRLLEGDVGSGKTVVAALAALMAVKAGLPRREAGGQAAFMAPTEILARQHFETLSGTLAPFNVEIALLTSSEAKIFIFGETQKTSRKNLIKEVKSGLIKILVGTHSLIQKNVSFKNLALAVIDEQHRFGVEQRASLCARINADINADKRGYIGVNQCSNQRESAYVPHLLSMTATPIPRTLALTIYGDLDISLIKELPPGRKNIITEIIPPARRRQAYEFIRRQVKEGRQVFVICPRIEPTTNNQQQTTDNFEKSLVVSRKSLVAEVKTEAKAVKEEYERLKKEIFPDLKIGLLHGKMKAKDKESTMKQFGNGAINILVSTSVVEVGVDIPNATIMMIEGAERFGLAQIYQLRGRVGRSVYQSYCFLFSDSAAGAALKRLEAVKTCRSGFELAEMDLKMRGPGDFYGIQQWGLPDLILASLADIELIEAARAEANKLLDEDPELKKYPHLWNRISEFKKTIHFE